MSMKATNWEFRNRATVFGLLLGLTFPLYAIDHQNSAAALSNFVAPRLHADPNLIVRVVFAMAAVLLCLAAFLRTWASAYLNADVVYASAVKSEKLVADGPYRRVRNPLYFANVLMAIAMGSLMSRLGLVVAVIAMFTFCYRLILREELELQQNQGERYWEYMSAVPRLWPSLRSRIPSAGRHPQWWDGFKAESWYWGFAVSLMAFTVTLELKFFFVILTASLLLFWVSSIMLRKPRASSASNNQ